MLNLGTDKNVWSASHHRSHLQKVSLATTAQDVGWRPRAGLDT